MSSVVTVKLVLRGPKKVLRRIKLPDLVDLPAMHCYAFIYDSRLRGAIK